MDVSSAGGERILPPLSRQFPSEEVNVDLTTCGLLVERAAELARLYHEHGNWNDVKRVWFDERRSNRSTRGSSRKIYRVLTSRFKNAPASLPNAGDLPRIFDECTTTRDEAQILYLYLVEDDPLVRYVVHEYVDRLTTGRDDALDFSTETLTEILDRFEYADGGAFDYADSTTVRWCNGFRSVLRAIGVLESQQAVVGSPPSFGDVPLLVAMGYSYERGDDGWVEAPAGVLYLLQPENRWAELFDRVASSDVWKFTELHGELRLRPTDDPFPWTEPERTNE